jgi:A/G-specific adenine glycosylase
VNKKRFMSNEYISKSLIKWYEANKRELPWRDISDPYRIWISEIILQQTRVNQGMNYYLRFVERFPDVNALATAHEDEVLKYWQGLGYYSRARNVHKTAQIIVEKHKSKFPNSYTEIVQLKGIGSYTAAAICSFAYNQAYAVVDGNVFRVISRLFAIETPIDSTHAKKEFSELATNLLDNRKPGIHNQAIMEFGALQCIPVQPDCNACPFQKTCKTYKLDLVDKLPIKASKTKVRERFFNYFFIQYQSKIFIQKRTEKDIWQNLYELPLIESDKLFKPEEIGTIDLIANIENIEINATTSTFKHILSHQRIFARFFTVKISKKNIVLNNLIEIRKDELDNFAVSRLTEMFLEAIN